MDPIIRISRADMSPVLHTVSKVNSECSSETASTCDYKLRPSAAQVTNIVK